MKKNIGIIAFVIILVLTIPPIVNYLMTFGNAETDNDWIGFFGAYLGALIGAAVAVIVSRIQVKGSNERSQNQLKLTNRVFIDYSMTYNSILLNDYDEESNKILLPHDVYLFIKHNDNNYLMNIEAHFVKLEFYGAADSVLDIKIKIRRSGYQHESDEWDYMYLAGWRKTHNVWIPINLPEGKRKLLELEAEYTTLMQERIKFVSDLLNKKERYLLVEDNEQTLIYERDLINEYYIQPGNKTSKN